MESGKILKLNDNYKLVENRVVASVAPLELTSVDRQCTRNMEGERRKC
jgi:hypothetical protein